MPTTVVACGAPRACPGRRRTRDPWLLRQPDPDAARLIFALPYLGTGASMYHAWPRTIGDAELCPVQLPGREGRLREPASSTYEELAEQFVTAKAQLLGERPYLLLGHCASAYAVVEIARAAQRHGLPAPERAIVSSMLAPHQSGEASILALRDDQLGDVVAGTLRARGAEPTPELIDLALGAMIADVQSYRRYRPAAPVSLPCPVTVIGWSDDASVPSDRLIGWAAAGGDVEQIDLEGDHWTFLGGPASLTALLAA